MLAYLTQWLVLVLEGNQAAIVFSAVDPKTGMAGGMLFALWLVFGNVIKATMEEGLFRGVMMTHFILRFRAWGTILLQTFFFAIWHLVWPLKQLIIGEISTGELVFETFGLLLATGIGGLVFGYIYYKTNNLWAAFLAHMINNTVLNLVFFRTAEGLQSGTEFGVFILIWLGGYLALLPIIARWLKNRPMPQFTSWR